MRLRVIAPRGLYGGLVAAGIASTVLLASAHVGFGEYAGTHAVALVPEPRSPLVGETVAMTFYLRDLHGTPAAEPLLAAVVVQEVLADGTEQGIFGTPATPVKNGKYEMSYAFRAAGHYRLDFSFWKPDEPEITRDAIFDIEVRERPVSAPLALLGASLLVLVGFCAGFTLKRRVKAS